LFGFLKGNTGSRVLLQKLDAFDNYLMSHSTNVCYLSLLLGMKLEGYVIAERRFKPARDAKDLHLLGLGCLLHDIGKMLVPKEILHKPGRLDASEMAEMRRHTSYGYQMVRRSIPGSAAQIVLNHHQRWDGSGYPNRIDSRTKEELAPLAGRQIPVFSRISIVADVYDAATSRRCYSDAKLPVQVLHEMRNSCQGFFDPHVESTFYRTVPPFPIGQVVTLSNGVEAAVVDFNPDCPARPKVKGLRTPWGQAFDHPTREEIDLSLAPDLEIAWVDRQDVRPYTACQQSNDTLMAIA
jgi:HD-GYP domain-containing protein (c-di-GMP phosphodiesterase class II)